VAKIQGKFIRHAHQDTDELFYVLDVGQLNMHVRELKDNEVVPLGKGEMFLAPKGVEHCPAAENEVCCLMIELAGTEYCGRER
ncbi:hypothetical protein K432DRAFT_287202, partial [Lepidopterella palustris CBS 459.81]